MQRQSGDQVLRLQAPDLLLVHRAHEIDGPPAHAGLDAALVGERHAHQRDDALGEIGTERRAIPQHVADLRAFGIEPDEPAPIAILDRRDRLDLHVEARQVGDPALDDAANPARAFAFPPMFMIIVLASERDQ